MGNCMVTDIYNAQYMKFHLYHRTASVVSWSEFLAADTEVLGSIPSATIFWVAVSLERCPLNLVIKNEALLDRKVTASV
jgi:hypothetical protein